MKQCHWIPIPITSSFLRLSLPFIFSIPPQASFGTGNIPSLEIFRLNTPSQLVTESWFRQALMTSFTRRSTLVLYPPNMVTALWLIFIVTPSLTATRYLNPWLRQPLAVVTTVGKLLTTTSSPRSSRSVTYAGKILTSKWVMSTCKSKDYSQWFYHLFYTIIFTYKRQLLKCGHLIDISVRTCCRDDAICSEECEDEETTERNMVKENKS